MTKSLTLHQPWASLIPLGAKTIETRGWSTTYRGRLAIHAGSNVSCVRKSTRTEDRYLALGGWTVQRDGAGLLLRGPISHPYRLPLGAVVATCDLVDVLPIHDQMTGVCRCDVGDEPYALHSSGFMMPKGQGIVGVFKRGVDNYRHPGWTPEFGDCLARGHARQQAPYGDFRCGRYAWLLDNVRPLPKPIPMRGAQGLRDLAPEIEAQLEGRLV